MWSDHRFEIRDVKVTGSIPRTWYRKAQDPLTRVRDLALLLQPQVLLPIRWCCYSGGHIERRASHLRANLGKVWSLCSLRYLEAVKTKKASSLGPRRIQIQMDCLQRWDQWVETATESFSSVSCKQSEPRTGKPAACIPNPAYRWALFELHLASLCYQNTKLKIVITVKNGETAFF